MVVVHWVWYSYVGNPLMSVSAADGGSGTFVIQRCLCCRWGVRPLSEYHSHSSIKTTSCYTTKKHTTTIAAFTQCQQWTTFVEPAASTTD